MITYVKNITSAENPQVVEVLPGESIGPGERLDVTAIAADVSRMGSLGGLLRAGHVVLEVEVSQVKPSKKVRADVESN